MDAPGERDVTLQRESQSLIEELRRNLPPLLWKKRKGNDASSSRGNEATPKVHRYAQVTKTDGLVALLDQFQEWPQLLDPYLQELLTQLVDAFLAYLLEHKDDYSSPIPEHLTKHGTYEPLPRSVCKLIYTLCKVRGVKVISRFFNNEPKYLEVVLRSFTQWDALKPSSETPHSNEGYFQPITWQERYVMLLWHSHLLLAPFPLKTLSSEHVPTPYDNLSELPQLNQELPHAALPILSICFKYVPIPGKEREAATLLLARLALRLDMQRLGLLRSLVDWALDTVRPRKDREAPSTYTCIGVLSFIYRLCATGQVEDLAPFLLPIFNVISGLTETSSTVSEIVATSASAKKIVLKVMRSIATLMLTLEEVPRYRFKDDDVELVLESTIDRFLTSLADSDTPVRFAASKALSYTTLKLDPEMAAEVIEAVISSLNENILYEKSDGSLITPQEAQNYKPIEVRRSTSAVDPLQWQGLTLTLAYLLFQRATPVSQLPDVLMSLVAALRFEQRSSTGLSIGTGVRDAANFGIWAISRKYSTKELLELQVPELQIWPHQQDASTIQALAIHLVCAGCLDPSGNIRRGSSAALQEMIGRHPDTILEGISLVQVVDYHAVARRSRALIEVTKAAAGLNTVYWEPLLDGLMGWRGICAPDAISRRTAAAAIAELSLQRSFETVNVVLERLTTLLPHTSPDDTETRHGVYLALAATVDAYSSRTTQEKANEDDEQLNIATLKVTNLWTILGTRDGPSKESLTFSSMRPDLTVEASARFLSALSRATLHKCNVALESIEEAIEILLICTQRIDETAVEATSSAATDLFALLDEQRQLRIVKKWVEELQTTQKLESGRGQISAFGAIFQRLSPSGGGRAIVIYELLRCTRIQEDINKRVTAVRCLSTGVLPYAEDVESLVPSIRTFLDDYTTDRRGDIGSLIRIEALGAVSVLVKTNPSTDIRTLYPNVARLAAEKLDKVRYQAWMCLRLICEHSEEFPQVERTYDHFSETNSAEHFLQLIQLAQAPSMRKELWKGLSTSACFGSESLIRASRYAVLRYLRAPDGAAHEDIAVPILEDLANQLEACAGDDRYVVPIAELIAFVLDNSDVDKLSARNAALAQRVFVTVQRSHLKSTAIPRIEAAIKVYAALWRSKLMRHQATKKLRSMLIHPYPRVRNVVADHLFMETEVDELKNVDWTRPAKELKVKVESLALLPTS